MIKVVALLCAVLLLGNTFPKLQYELGEDFHSVNYKNSHITIITEMLDNQTFITRIVYGGITVKAIQIKYKVIKGIVVEYEKKAKIIQE